LSASRPADDSGSDRPLRVEKRLIRRGVAWNAVGMTVSKGSSILAKLILARFLLPEHFGFISMVVVFTSITKIFADLGFRLSLIQRQRDHRTKMLYDSAFWLLFGAAFAAIAIMWLAGVPLLVWFYGEPRLATVAIVMSTVVLFQNMQVVPEARLARIMRFKQIAIADISGMFVGCAVAITLALFGAGVWSLVAQTLVAAACTSTVMFMLSGWRPRWRFSLATLGDLGTYSKFIVGSRILISIQQNLDYLLIGKLIGAHALGIYSIAFLLTETMRAQAYWLVSKAVFPFYSRAIGRDGDIRTVYLGTVRYMSVTVFPAAMMLILFADHLVPVLFTPTWNAAIVPIQILGAASMVVASAGTPGEVLRGIGRPDVDFRLNLAVALFVALPALWFGIHWLGLPGAALAVLTYYCVSRIAYGATLRQMIGLRTRELFGAVQQSLLGCACMVAAKLLLGPSHWFAGLIIAIAAYAFVILPLILPLLKDMMGTTPKSLVRPLERESAVPF
jgi:O-antigen/teichoic acid export membrane protein